MKKSIIIVLGILLTGVIFVSTLDPGEQQLSKKEVMTMHALLSVMDQMHLEPADINDEFSRKSFKEYIDYLDGAKRFFIQPEIEKLSKYEEQIDDQIMDRQLIFFDQSLDLLNKAIERGKMIYEEVIDDTFNIHDPAYFELDADKRSFAEDVAALKSHWHDLIEYQIVSKVHNKLEAQKDKAKEEQKDEAELISEAQKATKKIFDQWFSRMEEMRRSDRFEFYLNVFAQLYDPHSGYFSPKEKEEFDIRMGGKLEGIGARLSRSDDYIKVSGIIPGGPAWKGGDLEVGDLITKVTQMGEEGVDIVGFRTDDAVQLIRGKKGSVVILTVKKKDGSFADVEIERDEVIIDQAFAKSVIIDQGDQIQNIGYIKLPMFYSTFDGGNSCADDVAVEIGKLKKENVKGIILDLRYNGGGSLPDAINMSGLFIEKGPIVQVKSRGQKPEVYKDEDSDVAYDGPLIVMVNAISASASEILAAAMQDYGRAVIVGGNTTYGKGTVQRFLNLDRVIQGHNSEKPLGQVKVTMQQFYRVNGGSTQLRGVTPDIVLPDQYAFVDIGEKDYDEALQWTEINPTSYKQNVYQLPALQLLIDKSAKRVAQDSSFALVEMQGKVMKEMREESKMPLSLVEYDAALDERDERLDRFDGLMQDTVAKLEVHNLDADQAYLQTDSSRIARRDHWVKQIKKDIYLEESLHIMQDLIEADPAYVKH
ncbi:MAG: carboxy terminal-processing peptidase [Saprospiraceae bacterium]|nr:carboxy terminal-processing peptidase [Saprospiraceae bacterium]